MLCAKRKFPFCNKTKEEELCKGFKAQEKEKTAEHDNGVDYSSVLLRYDLSYLNIIICHNGENGNKIDKRLLLSGLVEEKQPHKSFRRKKE